MEITTQERAQRLLGYVEQLVSDPTFNLHLYDVIWFEREGIVHYLCELLDQEETTGEHFHTGFVRIKASGVAYSTNEQIRAFYDHLQARHHMFDVGLYEEINSEIYGSQVGDVIESLAQGELVTFDEAFEECLTVPYPFGCPMATKWRERGKTPT